MKNQPTVLSYIELTPADPDYAAVARRYNRHVIRQNRKMFRHHRWARIKNLFKL